MCAIQIELATFILFAIETLKAFRLFSMFRLSNFAVYWVDVRFTNIKIQLDMLLYRRMKMNHHGRTELDYITSEM